MVSNSLRMYVEPSLREPVMVLAFAGWNDAGDAATQVLGYLDHALASAPLAELEAEDFFDFTVRRPDVTQDERGRRAIVWPQTRFRFASIGPKREIVTALGVEPHMRWRSFCGQIVGLAKKLGVSQAVLLGAYQADVVYSQPVQVTGFATQSEALDRIGVAVSDYEGPTGIVGVLSCMFEEASIPVATLWAGLPHYINASPNPRGALALLQKLKQALDLEIDEEPLCVQAREFEERISKLVASDSELAEYVRQLKKREFAQ